jgi:hypothetical protein
VVLAHVDGGTSTVGVLRLLGNGAVDTTFGDDGLALTTPSFADGNAIRVQKNGRILAAGNAGETQRFLVARFLAA